MSDGSGSGSDGESESEGPRRRRTEERDGNGSMWSHLTAMREDVNSLTKIVTKFVKIVEGKAQVEHDAAEEVESGVKKRKSRGATAIKESLKRSGISSWTDADQIAVREYVNMRIPVLISLLFR